jgi:pSer/pThr/pTyr-binding forkhead associated (FHA) protein
MNLRHPVLQFTDEHGRPCEHPLDSTARVVIGRSPNATIPVLDDSSVSRLHAALEWMDTHWTVVDDGLSRNGTFVNGQRITGRRPLHPGDTIRVGEFVLTYRDSGQVPEATTGIAGPLPTRSALTDAQLKVLTALCRPYKGGATYASPPSNQQLADELYISTETVKTHLRALFAKFGLDQTPDHNKRTRLAQCAMLGGVVTDHDL